MIRRESKRTPDLAYVDQCVGARLLRRRIVAGLSQTELGKALGVSSQQIQKYEQGVDRLAASRLFHAARALEVSIAYFFVEAPDTAPAEPQLAAHAPALTLGDNAIFHKRETLELVRSYFSIGDPDQRRNIYDLIQAIAARYSEAQGSN